MKFRVSSIITIFIVSALLIGCGPSIKNFVVEIESEPSGAMIEINDDYIGKTPLSVEIKGWESTRTFVRDHKIVAHPVFKGGYIQQKFFSDWYEPDLRHGDTIPKKIYFNMHLVPGSDKLDININK